MADTPDFRFLRNTPVDLSRYLPAFLFRDTSFSNTLNTLSYEHEAQRLTLTDVAQQAFVKTATWGLDDWEEFVGLEHEPADTVQTRRNKILMKLADVNSVTVPFLTRLVNLYVADGQSVVIDHPETYSIEILHHGGQVIDYDGLENAINTYIPAHIGHTLLTYTKGRLAVYAAGIVRGCKTMRIGMTLQPNNKISPTPLYAAGAIIHQYHKQTIHAGG